MITKNNEHTVHTQPGHNSATKIAVVFPGQGSQAVGMLQDFYQNYAIFRDYMAQASEILGYDLWSLIQTDGERLNQTRFTQPALLACEIAIWAVAQQLGVTTIASGITHTSNITNVDGLAGHSLGEYSALVAGGVLTFADALRLVALRGQWMQEASLAPTGMVVLVGLDETAAQQVCALCGSGSTPTDPQDPHYLTLANCNSHQQFVLSGYLAACEQAITHAKALGAKIAKLLPVSVASHSALMQPAAERLAQEFGQVTFNPPQLPIYRDIDGTLHQDPAAIPIALAQQTVSGVQWIRIIENMLQDGVTKICECGPKNVLTGLNRRIIATWQAKLATGRSAAAAQTEIIVESWDSCEHLRASLQV